MEWIGHLRLALSSNPTTRVEDYRDDDNFDPQVDKIPVRKAFEQLRIFVGMRGDLCKNKEEKEV